jgi:hypothetical protein
MGILRRLIGKRRKGKRVRIKLPVTVEAASVEGETFWTEDLSESGLRMQIPEASSLSDLTGSHRDVGFRITLREDEEPVRMMAEPVWTARMDDGKQASGWMFCSYQGDSRERLVAFIEDHEGEESEE